MKKQLLLTILFFYSIFGYSQFPESFEGSTTQLPVGWKYYQNNTGPLGNNQFWKISTLPSYLCTDNGNNTALMDAENIGAGNTSVDYLTTPRFTVPENGQFRFFTKQVGSEDNGVIYKLQVSINPNQDFLVDYVTLKTWTETEMNAIYNVCEEKTFDFPDSYFGQQVYVALVKQFTQPGTALSGDRWLVDKINVVQKCQSPTLVNAVNPGTTSYAITWVDSNAPRWDIKYGLEGVATIEDATLISNFGFGSGNVNYSNPTPFNHRYEITSGLLPQTSYSYWIRSRCTDDNLSPWIGPFSFTTIRFGSSCISPIEVSALPYQSDSNTNLFGNFTNTIQGSGCGAIPATTNYLSGFDAYYRYTAIETGLVSFKLTPSSPRSSLFIYPACPTTGNCLTGVANSNSDIRLINNFSVTAGEDYIIVISSEADVLLSSTAYKLLIQQEQCNPPVGVIPTGAAVTTTSATLSWSNPTAATSWQVVVQPFNSQVPPGSGITVTGSPSVTLNDLTPGVRSQYWVRAECSPGVFTSWAGPYPFSTDSCIDADKCILKFKMSDSGNNGWQGAIMQIRQNGVIIREIGSTFTNGATAPDIDIPLCKNVDFDIFWSVGGLFPQQCKLQVINTFGQTLYNRAASNGGVNTILLTRNVNCDGPVCDIPPTNVIPKPLTITTTSGTVSWEAFATTAWDIYIVEAGNPAPNNLNPASGAGLYLPNVTSLTNAPLPFSYNFTGLLADTVYNVYVRVVCSPLPSLWSTPGSFTTLPSCFKPTALAVPTTPGTVTTTSAKFTWTKGKPADTKWELLLVPTNTTVLPTIPPPINPAFVGQFLQIVDAPTNPSVPVEVNGLTPATIYNTYVRTVCSDSDKSKWSVIKQFNTVTCAPTEKCNYQIVLKDIAINGEQGPNDSWNGARIQIRQNGIITQTLGASNINGLPINVPLCSGVPFDIYWSVRGSNPANVKYDFYNPFGDVIDEIEFDDEDPLTVLFSDTTNCVPTGCLKPTALTANVSLTTSTTAQLAWTDIASTSQWEIYVTPESGIPPVNGNPLYTSAASPITVFGSNIYYLADTNPFTVTGLQPGTKYKYYIRSVCSTSSISNWTLINPFSFITKPLNDACLDAQLVPVSTTWDCDATTQTIGNTLGATLSLPTVPGAGCGSTNDDVWYKFVATNNIHILDVEQILPLTDEDEPDPEVVPLSYMLLSGDCATLVKRVCSSEELTVATDLIPGDTYYLRVYTSGSVVGQTAKFSLCVGTPPAPALNDNCATATNVTVNSVSDCTIFTPGNIVGATASLPALSAPCLGNANDDVWFSFVANSDTQIINLLNIQGSTTNLNHALYSGTCDALTRLTCSTANSLQSSTKNLVIGQTYYVRVWSNEITSQVVIFDICIKPASTCQTAAPFCGANAANPYIYQNTVGLPDTTTVACLFTIPNPTYYTLQVDQTGRLVFQIIQSDSFDAAGNPVGTTRDVDFVAWGPFPDTESCAQISLAPCSPPCPNNIGNPTFYPFGNIVDCSYAPATTETLTIPNAIAGQFYVILVTNFSNQPGYIRLIQTNFGAATAGETVCCDVDLGPNVSLCESSKLLSALQGVDPDAVVPSTYVWYRNNELIPGQTGATYLATRSGTYRVQGACGVNDVEDEMILTLSPIVIPVTPSDYRLCDDVSNDGKELFDLTTLAAQALGDLDPTKYRVTYHLTQLAAIQDNNAIIQQTGFENTTPLLQTIYIRIESIELSICFGVVPANLVVIPTPAAPIIVDVIECEKAPIQVIAPLLPVGVDVEWFDAPVLGNVVTNITRNQLGSSTFYAETILANLDYVNTKSTITIPAGQTSATVSISTLADSISELAEAFTLATTVTSSNTINTTATGIATITDTALSSTVWVSNPICLEGSAAVFNVKLSNPSNTNTTIDFKTIVGSADSLDFTETIIPVNILAGQTTLSVSVPTLTDSLTEGNETFTLKGTVTSTNTTNTNVVGLATVIEAGSLPILSVDNIYTVEGSSATFTFTLSSPSTVATVINYATQFGSAGSIGCKSAVRTPVKLEILTAPAAPTTTLVEQCATKPTPQTLTAIATPLAGTTVVWYDSLLNGNSIVPTINTIGTKTFYAEAVDSVTGCKSLIRTPATVTLNDNPMFGIQGDCIGLNYTLDILPIDNYNVATAVYEWKNPSGAVIGNKSTIIVKTPGAYTCKVTNDKGCSTEEVKSFNYVSCEVQKGISPKGNGQGDGKNDFLDLSNINVTKLDIFNRYGLKVYSKENYVREWYGQTDKGDELPDGTYYYVVEIKNEDPKTGWIYINREQ